MSDIAGFPTGHPARETAAPAPESYTELPAEQLGLAAPYAPLTEADDPAAGDDDPAAPGDDDADDRARQTSVAEQFLTVATPVPVPPRPDDPTSVPVSAPQSTATAPPRPDKTGRG